MKKKFKNTGWILLVLSTVIITSSTNIKPNEIKSSEDDFVSFAQELSDLTAQAKGDDAAIVLYINTFNKVYERSAHKEKLKKYKTWFDEQITNNLKVSKSYAISLKGMAPFNGRFVYVPE